MTDTPTLLSAAPSPFVRKVRVLARELGRELALDSVMASPIEPRDEVTAANPLGKIPALRLPSGELLYDSAVICRFLGEGSAFYPSGSVLWRALRREALADGLIDAALLARYETTLRPEALRWTDWREGQMGKVRRALAAMSADLSDDAGLDIGDIATGCALAYLDFRYPELDWRAAHPGLREYAAEILSRPSFAATTPQ